MKKSIQLFQFKYYSEQQKLLLSKEELEQVKNGVIRPPSSNPYESRLIASKILIKVLPFFSLLLLSLPTSFFPSSSPPRYVFPFSLPLSVFCPGLAPLLFPFSFPFSFYSFPQFVCVASVIPFCALVWFGLLQLIE